MALKKLTKAQQEQRLIDLCNTLEEYENIEKIYFNETGEHFFIAREHKGKLYSRLGMRGEEIDVPTGKRIKATPDIIPGTLLVKTLTRAEVLKMRPKEAVEA